MRVLALADKPPPMDPALMARKLGVQAIVCLGARLGESGDRVRVAVYGDARVQWISGARVVLLD